MVMDTPSLTDTVMTNRRLIAHSSLIALFLGLSSHAIGQQYNNGMYVMPTTAIRNNPAAAPSTTLTQQIRSGFVVPDGELTPVHAWEVIPRIRLSEYVTDNIDLSSNKKTDFVTSIAPGIRATANTPRLKAQLDYEFIGQIYASNSDASKIQNNLNTIGRFEGVENWLFVDFSALISQQMLSPFGSQSASNSNINANRAQVQTYQVSPFIRGPLGGNFSEYLVRYNASTTRTGNTSVSDVDISQLIAQLRSGNEFQKFGWTIDAVRQDTDYTLGRNYQDERLRGLLSYQLIPELSISGVAGHEANNYMTNDKESYSNYGAGFDWRPTGRTIVSALQEKRFFGWGHNILLSHRFPTTSIQYSDTRDTAFISAAYAAPGQGTLFNQYFDLLSNMIPDPVARTTYINNLFSQSGINPNSLAVMGFLANQPQIRRSQDLSLVFYGIRNTLTLRGSRVSSEPLTLAGIANPYPETIQKGLSIAFAHRLTPLTSLNALGLRQNTNAPSVPNLDNTLTMYQLGVSTQLGPKTFASLGIRHSIYDSNNRPYSENAIQASILLSF